ncbi:MAG: phosphate acyltransferase [Desulfovibrionaceae bacterium]
MATPTRPPITDPHNASPRIASLDELLDAARSSGPPPRIAIAPCAEEFVLRAGADAAAMGLAEPLFIGDRDASLRKAEAAGIDISPFGLIHEPDETLAVQRAVAAYRAGEAGLLMKGLVSTATLLRAVLDKQSGVPPRGLLSHVTAFRLPHPRQRPEDSLDTSLQNAKMARVEEGLTLLTDAAVNIKPSLQRKVDIIKNALEVARVLGMAQPRVALLAATEKVNYPAMPSTLDADIISKMAAQGEFGEALVAGPLSLDLAISPASAACKGLGGPVPGRADVLVAPDIEAGNVLYKSLSALAQVPLASVVVGSEVPVVVPSRADSERSKLCSIALAVLLSRSASAAHEQPVQE